MIKRKYLSYVVSEVAHRTGTIFAHGAIVPVLQLLVVRDETLGGDALLSLPRGSLLHAVGHEHMRLQVGLLLAAEVALLALVQVDRLGGGAVLPQQVIATRLGFLRLNGECGLLPGQGGDCCRTGEHVGGGCRLSLQMHGVDVVDEEAGVIMLL